MLNVLDCPKVSVCVAIYNVARWLGYCLESVTKQTEEDWECILVNDGSTDESLDICKKYAAIDSRFRIINQENKGLSGVRNASINAAQGEYILFIDGDDYLPANALEYYLSNIGDADLFACGCTAVTADSEIIRNIGNDVKSCMSAVDAINALLHRRMLTAVWCKLYRRSSLDGLTFNCRLNEGEDLMFHFGLFLKFISDKTYKVKVSDEPVYFYRILSTSLSHGKGQQRQKRLLTLINEMDAAYDNNKSVISRYCMHGFVSNIFYLFGFHYRLQNMIKCTDSVYMPLLKKWVGLAKDTGYRDMKDMVFVSEHSIKYGNCYMTMRWLPQSCREVIKRMLRK